MALFGNIFRDMEIMRVRLVITRGYDRVEHRLREERMNMEPKAEVMLHMLLE